MHISSSKQVNPVGRAIAPNSSYRQNECKLPLTWTLSPLREVAPLQRGFDLPTSQIRPGPYPVVYSNGVLDHHRQFMVKSPGVVTGRSGTLGRVHFIEADYWPHNTSLWVTSFCGNDPKFIYYLYSYIGLDRFHSGSGVPTLNRNDVHQQVVACPPVSEQRAIVEVLSDVDELLEALGSLIIKKRVIKSATMQQLLSGVSRLPGFSGKWMTKRIGDISDIDPENLSNSTDQDFKFNYISLEQIEAGILLGFSEERFQTAPSRARRILRDNDILMSTVRPNLMAHFLYNNQVDNAVCSTGFAVLRSKNKLCNPGFLYAHLFGHIVNRQIEGMLVGSNYPAINSYDVRRIEIPLAPTVDEQSAIVSVLSAMDAEIAALEKRRDKVRAIKQGMMQQLLTGRIRLPLPAESGDEELVP